MILTKYLSVLGISILICKIGMMIPISHRRREEEREELCLCPLGVYIQHSNIRHVDCFRERSPGVECGNVQEARCQLTQFAVPESPTLDPENSIPL